MCADSIDRLVDEWLAIDVCPQTRAEIEQLHKEKNYAALDAKLSHRIAFGTAGLRSSMEAGFAHMNDVTVLQASQGLVAYLEQNGAEKAVVVGYDHRYNSQRFAEITASVALTRGFKVFYLGNVHQLSKETLQKKESDGDPSYVHTPLVPFAIDHYGAGAGVMVTASHNPAQDNGYKVYYGNGCQIIPPVDAGIAAAIDKNLKPWDRVWEVSTNFAEGLKSGLLLSAKQEVTAKYLAAAEDKLIKNTAIDFRFVYTPVHGVGGEIFDQVLGLFGANAKMIPTPAQSTPDPSFKTVKFPNPEEKGALDLAIAEAEKEGVDLVVANDPDADRFSVAVKCSGKWRQLTGNEIGFLFAIYVIEETPKEELSKVWLVNSTVSSQILSSMAHKEGFHFQDTLTGFKWIGNKAIELKKRGFKVPFGYEEAIGFMFDLVNDKDGISASIIWLQLYQKWFANSGINPIDKLEQGYAKYGFYKEFNGYYKFQDLTITPRIFQEIRDSFEGSSPQTVGEFTVAAWRDLTVGYDSSTPDHTPLLPTDPSSQMITAVFTDKSQATVRFTCRGSGTEPKLKVYIEGTGANEHQASDIAARCWNTLKAEWFKPQQNKLQEITNQ